MEPYIVQQLVWGVVAICGIICTLIYKVKALKYTKGEPTEFEPLFPISPFNKKTQTNDL